jgi:cytochrome c oxidase cbb3-type subunit 3
MCKLIKNMSVLILLNIITWGMYAQDAATGAAEAEPSLWESISFVDWMLILIAIGLLIPIFYLSKIFKWTLKHYLNQRMEKSKLNSIIWAALLVLPGWLSAQTTAASASSFEGFNFLRWFLLLVILMEVFVLAFFGKMLFTQFALFEGAISEETAKESWFAAWWKKANNFGTQEDEAKLDTGHNYDGIRELDNFVPGWFTAAFVASIIFAIVYMWQYHIAKVSPLSGEEYRLEVEAADLAHQQYLKTAGSSVDENSLALSTDKADLDEGKKIFTANCAACHLADGGGLQGPNLTDNNWVIRLRRIITFTRP